MRREYKSQKGMYGSHDWAGEQEAVFFGPHNQLKVRSSAHHAPTALMQLVLSNVHAAELVLF